MFESLEQSQEELSLSTLPSQEAEPLVYLNGAESGHKLFSAILNRAIRDYKQYLWRPDSKQFYLAIDAWLWLSCDDESHELTTFVDICKLLDQNPDIVRHKIAELVEHEGRNSSPIPVTHAA